MKIYFLIPLLIFSRSINAQTVAKMPDSIRRIVDEYNGVSNGPLKYSTNKISSVLDSDRVIKDRLIKLALNNDQIVAANANIEIANVNRKKANSTILSAFSLGANANEFVINNTPQATLFPKYNIGFLVPLDVFAKSRAQKSTADQDIIIADAQRELLKKNIKARVLILYVTYKEKKQQVEFQKIANDEILFSYENAQKDFKDQAISLEELNKIYRNTLSEKSILAEKERDFEIAVLQIEEIIGVPLQTVLFK